MVASLSKARKLADKHGLTEVDHSHKYGKVTFQGVVPDTGEDCTFEYYYTSGTVITTLPNEIHGHQGRMRCCIDTPDELSAIFANARVSTGKGRQYLDESWLRQKRERCGCRRGYGRGRCFTGKLFDGELVQKWYTDGVCCVAMGETATMLLYDDGDYASTCELPQELYGKLKRKWKGKKEGEPKLTARYCVLGSMERYYAEYKGGERSGELCERLEEILEQEDGKVKCVAFGKNWNDFFVLFRNGKAYWKGLPEELDKTLKCQKLSFIDKVSLGPKGEWYVRFVDGNGCTGHLSEEAESELCALGEKGRKIRDVIFGGSNTYMIRFDK